MTPRRDLFRRELQNLVGRAANLEGADGLQALGLEPDLSRHAGKRRTDQRRLDGDAGDAGRCFADRSKLNQFQIGFQHDRTRNSAPV